jgi:hypothetical protein
MNVLLHPLCLHFFLCPPICFSLLVQPQTAIAPGSPLGCSPRELAALSAWLFTTGVGCPSLSAWLFTTGVGVPPLVGCSPRELLGFPSPLVGCSPRELAAPLRLVVHHGSWLPSPLGCSPGSWLGELALYLRCWLFPGSVWSFTTGSKWKRLLSHNKQGVWVWGVSFLRWVWFLSVFCMPLDLQPTSTSTN